MGESIRLPGGITSVDHVFRVPLKWAETGSVDDEFSALGKDVGAGAEAEGGVGGGGGGAGGAPSLEVFAR